VSACTSYLGATTASSTGCGQGVEELFSLALLNGGIGTRVAAGRPKQFIVINGIPILVYSLVAADGVDSISQIVLNYPPGWRDDVEKIVTDYAIKTRSRTSKRAVRVTSR